MVGRTPAGYLGRMNSQGRPGETRDERADRNLVDLLQELRVATLGVQVLFGFLLGLPFTSHFSALHPWQRGLAVASAVLLVTSYVLPGTPAVALTVVISVLFGVFWFALPIARRQQVDEAQADGPKRDPDEQS